MARGGRQFLQVMGDEDAREVRMSRRQQVDRGEQLLARGDVEARGRLIEQ
ncbi:hypothetical protein [Demequina sp. NBRC 110051]